MQRLIFLSHADTERAYVVRSAYDSDSYQRRRHWQGRVLTDCANEYYTGRDGLIMHGPEQLIPESHWLDFLQSLALYLGSLDRGSPDFWAAGEVLVGFWPTCELSNEQILFLAEVKSESEGKPARYWSLDERKVSTSDSKRHDRRYTRVPEGTHGGMESAWKLYNCHLAEERRHGGEALRAYVTRREIYRVCADHGHGGGYCAEEIFTTGHAEQWGYRDAISVIERYYRGFCELTHAGRSLDCMKRNIVNAAERAEKEAAEAAAKLATVEADSSAA